MFNPDLKTVFISIAKIKKQHRISLVLEYRAGLHTLNRPGFPSIGWAGPCKLIILERPVVPLKKKFFILEDAKSGSGRN